MWEEFGEAMDKDFRKTVWHLRRVKRGSIQAIYIEDGTLLTSNEEVIRRWKEHFEELLNPINPSSMAAADLEDEG